MTVDLKWPAALIFPFAVMAWVDAFVWFVGLQWSDEAREFVAVMVMVFGSAVGVGVAMAMHQEGVKWQVRLPWPRSQHGEDQ